MLCAVQVHLSGSFIEERKQQLENNKVDHTSTNGSNRSENESLQRSVREAVAAEQSRLDSKLAFVATSTNVSETNNKSNNGARTNSTGHNKGKSKGAGKNDGKGKGMPYQYYLQKGKCK